MKALILCGYRHTDSLEPALGLARDADGSTLLDRRLTAVRELGLEPVCVLAGSEADEQLRQCRHIQHAELAFDTAEPRALIANIKAGAAVTRHEAFFVLPVEVPMPHPAVWALLRNEYAKVGFGTETAILQVPIVDGGLSSYGFPLLFTRTGAESLLSTPDVQSLVDARLTYLRLAHSANAA